MPKAELREIFVLTGPELACKNSRYATDAGGVRSNFGEARRFSFRRKGSVVLSKARRYGAVLTWGVKLGEFGGDSRTAASMTVEEARIGGLVLHGVTFVVLDPPLNILFRL